jgi:type IV pilus assembly protein PilX
MFIKKNRAYKQTGAVLVISLIILLLLTIIGVTGMQTTSLEERMAGNMRDKSLAFESAEAALRDAETFMETVFTLGAFNADGSDGYYDNSIRDIWTAVDWDGSNVGNTNKAVTAASAIPGVEPGKYVIQYIADSKEEDITGGINLNNIGQGTGGGNTSIFRITARGTGASGKAAVVLQTLYGRKL